MRCIEPKYRMDHVERDMGKLGHAMEELMNNSKSCIHG